MRELKIGSQNFTQVVVRDEPGQGGACHEYYVCRAEELQNEIPVPVGEFGRIQFQNGPVKEFGVNGCHQAGGRGKSQGSGRGKGRNR